MIPLRVIYTQGSPAHRTVWSCTVRLLRTLGNRSFSSIHISPLSRAVLMAQPRFAVAFDIDGVLTRAPNPIPGAKEVGYKR